MTVAADPATGPGTLGFRARWALAFRLARREARRHPWRQALVVLMIFVPVLATFATFSGITTMQAISTQRLAVGYQGAVADDYVGAPAGDAAGPVVDGVSDTGTEVERFWEGGDWFLRPDDGDTATLVGANTTSIRPGSRMAGRYLVDRGRLPRAADEAFVTAPLADDQGWAVGSTIESAKGDFRVTVVGVGRTADELGKRLVVLSDRLPASYWAIDVGMSGLPFPAASSGQQVARIFPSVDATAAERADLAAAQRDGRFLNPIGSDTDVPPLARLGIVVGAAGLASIVAVVASAAFAVGARRQLRTVGLLSTSGADGSVVRAALVLQGAIPGVIASGLAVGLVALGTVVANAAGWPERIAGVQAARVELSLAGAFIATVIGTGAGLVAAWQPARTAARVPVLTALAGRRPAAPVPARVPLAGAALVVGGFVALAAAAGLDDPTGTRSALLAVVGILGFVLGGVGVAPVLVAALGPVAGRTSGIVRLALRGLARHRTQSAATVAAIAVALALPIGLLAALPAPAAADAPARVTVDGVTRTETSLLRHRRAVSATVHAAASYDLSAPRTPAVRARIESAAASVAEVLGPDAALLDLYAVARPTTPPDVADEGDGVSSIDGGDPVLSVAVMAPADARRLLTPEALELLDGAALPLLATLQASFPHTLALPGGGSIPVAEPPADQLPDLGGIEADLLVVGGPGAPAFTPDELVGRAVLRDRPPTPSEAVGLDRASGNGSWSDLAPTLAEVRAALAPDAATPATDVELDVWTSVFWHRDQGPDRRGLAVAGLAAAATLLALLVLTITLSLRAVDGADDRRAAVAAGAAPALLRRQRAVEGLVLAGLGALLALPLGWLPVVAIKVGGRDRLGWADQIGPGLPNPGWLAVPVLVVPVLLAGVLWLVVPAVRAATVGRRPTDQLLPRW